MKAISVIPGDPDSLRLADFKEPRAEEGSVLVEALAVGLCATDREVIDGGHGEAPEGHRELVLGHENLGRVREAPAESGLEPGDLVVGIVRSPDPEPCAACAAGEFDMCLNGGYREHGIMAMDGFARQLWRAEPDELVRLDPELEPVGVLLEPATVIAKAWEQIEEIGRRAFFEPKVAAVTGAGPVGLLAAYFGIRRGLEVHVFDLEEGVKADLVRDLGGIFHTETLPESGLEPDVLIECTGVPSVVLHAVSAAGRNSITCLAGVSDGGEEVPVDVGALNKEMVLGNAVVFGTVNANRRHYLQAVEAFTGGNTAWLRRLITRTVPLSDWRKAFDPQEDDIKVVIDFSAG